MFLEIEGTQGGSSDHPSHVLREINLLESGVGFQKSSSQKLSGHTHSRREDGRSKSDSKSIKGDDTRLKRPLNENRRYPGRQHTSRSEYQKNFKFPDLSQGSKVNKKLLLNLHKLKEIHKILKKKDSDKRDIWDFIDPIPNSSDKEYSKRNADISANNLSSIEHFHIHASHDTLPMSDGSQKGKYSGSEKSSCSEELEKTRLKLIVLEKENKRLLQDSNKTKAEIESLKKLQDERDMQIRRIKQEVEAERRASDNLKNQILKISEDTALEVTKQLSELHSEKKNSKNAEVITDLENRIESIKKEIEDSKVLAVETDRLCRARIASQIASCKSKELFLLDANSHLRRSEKVLVGSSLEE